MSKLHNLLFNKLMIAFFVAILSTSALSEIFQLGDLAPRGAPDGQLNAADSLLLQRMVLGDLVPTNDEILLGDVAPLGNVDGVLNAGDLVVQQRAVLGQITLGTVNITSLQPPVLDAAVSPTNSNPYTITGTATPNTLIDIYVEGVLQKQITSNVTDGTFSVDVYLFDGMNNIHATETDGIDSSSASNIVQIQYDNIIDRNNLPTNISVDTVWTPGSLPQPYVISSVLTVDPGVNFVIQPGTELKFETSTSLVVNGNLEIIGTGLSRVLLTSNQLIKSASDWTGIEVRTGGSVNIKYAEITYASAGVYFYAGSGGSVANSRIYNNNYGIRSYGDNSIEANNPLPIVTFNSIFDNTTRNYDTNNYVNNENTVLDANSNWWGTLDTVIVTSKIYDYLDNTIDSPQVDISSILESDGGAIYDHAVLTGRLQQTNVTLSAGLYTLGSKLLIDVGQTLTIEAGSLIENGRLTSDLGANGAIEVKGTLNIIGTQQNRVVFTSINPIKGVGDWQGITTLDGGIITINYADIEFAGDAFFFQQGSTGIITNSRIRNNIRGIRAQGHPAIPDKNPLLTINNNSIHNNTANSIYTVNYYDSVNATLNANNNWWGTTNASDIVYSIYDYQDNPATSPPVDIGPILDSEDGNVYSHTVLHGRLPQTVTTLNGLYAIGGLLTVDVGQTLIIQAGSEIEIAKKPFVGNTSGKIEVKGTLTISGTEQNRVVLASSFAQKSNNDWDGIQVNTGGTANIDYAIIKNANVGIKYLAGSNGTVSNSIFSDNNYAFYMDGVSGTIIDANTITYNQYGIYLTTGANPTISSNVIVGNTYGIYLFGISGDPQPSIINNEIYGNVSANLFLSFIDTTTVLNVADNWWGTDDVNVIRSKIVTNGGSNQSLSVLLDSIALLAYSTPFPTSVVVSESYISPATSTGIQDSVQFTAGFTETQNWTVDIRDSANQTIKSFIGSSAAISVAWDGKNTASQNVADGVYSFAISIDGVELTNNYTDRVVVDNTLPTASFISGLNNSIIGASSYKIHGIAADNNFSSYLVEYGVGTVPASWITIEALKNTPITTTFSALVDWKIVDFSIPITVLPNGTYTIRLSVTDLSGNTNIQEVLVQIDLGTLFIHNVSQDITTINPTTGDIATISFQLSKPATVSLQFSDDQTKSVVRTITQNFPVSAGVHTMSWDGKNDAGEYLADEAYTYALFANDGANSFNYLPTYSPSNPAVSPAVPGATNVDFNVAKNEFYKIDLNNTTNSRIKLCVRPGSVFFNNCATTGAIVVSNEAFAKSPSLTFYWNGRDGSGSEDVVDSSDYRYYFPAPTELPENTIFIVGSEPLIKGEEISPNIEVKSNPYLVHHSFEEFSQIKYRVDQNSTVTAKLLPPGIYDPNDPSAITLLSNQPVSADIIQTLTWLGYATGDTNNILVSDEGLYTFTIEATSDVTGFTTLYRGALTLYQ